MNCAEKIFAGQIACDDKGTSRERVSVASAMRSGDFVNVQNVHEYLEAVCNKPTTLDDFPEALPPWPSAIVFFAPHDFCGAEFAVCYDCRRWEEVFKQYEVEFQPSDECRYGLLGSLWVSFPGKPAVNIGTFAIAYDASGDTLQHRTYISDEIDEYDPGMRGILTNAMIVTVAACSFANCRNTVIQKAKASRQVKRRARAKDQPVFEHYELIIEPVRRILEGQGRLLEHGDIKHSLHICRGHFSHYGESYGKKKLFGRLEGRFWIPQHARGALEVGVVTKDYKVLTG